MANEIELILQAIVFNDEGLIPVIVQDHATNDVLMLAYMNEDTLRQTLDTGKMTYWSRSRAEVWVKGATSGKTQSVRQVLVDCDGDTLLFKVAQKGQAACHTGHRSCFHRTVGDGQMITVGKRLFDPEDVYGKNGKSS